MSGRPGRPLWPLARLFGHCILDFLVWSPRYLKYIAGFCSFWPEFPSLPIWMSEKKSDTVCYFLVSFPCPWKSSVQKKFYLIKAPYKISLRPIPKDKCPFGCHYNYHNQKWKQQDQWQERSTGQMLCPCVKMNTFGQEVTVCLQRTPKSFIIYG